LWVALATAIILDVIVYWIIPKFRKNKKEKKLEIPIFKTHSCHTRFDIGDSNAIDVVNFLLQYLRADTKMFMIEHEKLFIKNEVEYYSPDQYSLPSHGIVGYGGMVIFPDALNARKNDKPAKESLYDKYFITVAQGGDKKCQVSFDTDNKFIYYVFPKILLKRLQEQFTVTKIVNLPME